MQILLGNKAEHAINAPSWEENIVGEYMKISENFVPEGHCNQKYLSVKEDPVRNFLF